MEEEKIIEDGNNEIAVEQSAPVVEETPVEQPAPAPVAEPIAAPVPEAPKKKSALPIILVIILLLAVGGFAVWYFVLGGNESKKEKPTIDELKEELKEEKEENKEEKPKEENEDETISDELLSELKTIALLDVKSYSDYYDPLLGLNGVVNILPNNKQINLIWLYAQKTNLLKEFRIMEVCKGGSEVCYGIPKEQLDGVLKKYGITNFDTSELTEYDGTYILQNSGYAVTHNIEHNISSYKDGDSIVITDKMDLILISTKEKDDEKTKEYKFKKNNDGDYYLATVFDK